MTDIFGINRNMKYYNLRIRSRILHFLCSKNNWLIDISSFFYLWQLQSHDSSESSVILCDDTLWFLQCVNCSRGMLIIVDTYTVQRLHRLSKGSTFVPLYRYVPSFLILAIWTIQPFVSPVYPGIKIQWTIELSGYPRGSTTERPHGWRFLRKWPLF